MLFHYLHQAYDLKACSVIYDTLYQPNQPNPASQQAFYETQVTSLRENKPNQFDPLNIWEDVLMPRIQFFESLVMKKMNSGYSSNYGFSPSLSSLAREMRLQLSNIAKEHGLLNTAVKLFPQSCVYSRQQDVNSFQIRRISPAVRNEVDDSLRHHQLHILVEPA